MEVRTGFSQTRIYNVHHVYIEKDGKNYHGICKFQNRTWERFSYETALRNAIKTMDRDTQEKALEALNESKSLLEATTRLKWL